MAQQVEASLARLSACYPNPAVGEKWQQCKESDFITPPRLGFPSILGVCGFPLLCAYASILVGWWNVCFCWKTDFLLNGPYVDWHRFVFEYGEHMWEFVYALAPLYA